MRKSGPAASRQTATSGLNPERFACHYDYLIVGGGTAGCVLARRLVERTDVTVLLLEAGGSGEGLATLRDPVRWEENMGAPHDWNYTYAPGPALNQRSFPLSQGKVLGGSGSTNGLIWARGHRASYDEWAAAGNPGWDYESVLPLFKKAEEWQDGASAWRGARGPLRIERAKNLHPVGTALLAAGQALGMPYLDDSNVAEPLGVGPLNLNVRAGERCSPADAYLRPVLGHPHLTVLTGAQVQKLVLMGPRCTGLDFVHQGRRYSVSADQEVILTAGAINTPRLLLLSGIGPPAALARLGIPVHADLPGVGQNLQDHPRVTALCFEAKELLAPCTNNAADSAAFWKSRPALLVPDLMILAAQTPCLTPEIATQYAPPANSFCLVPALVRVESRGYVKMLTARPNGPLEIQPNLLVEPADLEALLTGMEMAMILAAQPAYQHLIKRWVAPTTRLGRVALRGFLRKACTSCLHPTGTCAMGSHPAAVVDAQLRVQGLEGLRIADASIMPTITSANTMAPTVLIAEFAANLIRASWQGVTERKEVVDHKQPY